jgi:hypothetical protein
MASSMGTQVLQFFALHGNATTIYFTVPGATDGLLLTGAVPWGAADCLISKDGGNLAQTTNQPTLVNDASDLIYAWSLTAAELTALKVVLILKDVAGGPLWTDTTIYISTELMLGRIYCDATTIGNNASGIQARGVGTGFGLRLEGDTDLYETNLFDQLEGTEPAAGGPADNASFAAILQFLKRRKGNRITQTSTAQTQYKDDGVTISWTRTVSDDGATFTITKVT